MTIVLGIVALFIGYLIIASAMEDKTIADYIRDVMR